MASPVASQSLHRSITLFSFFKTAILTGFSFPKLEEFEIYKTTYFTKRATTIITKPLIKNSLSW